MTFTIILRNYESIWLVPYYWLAVTKYKYINIVKTACNIMLIPITYVAHQVKELYVISINIISWTYCMMFTKSHIQIGTDHIARQKWLTPWLLIEYL